MPRHPERSFIDQLLDGLSQIAQGMAETVADRIVSEFTPIVEPVAKPVKAKTGKVRKRKRTPRSSADGAEAYRRWAASAKPENPPATVTHYDVLGLSRTAEPEAIAGAYRGLAKKWHPDVAGKSAKAEARMRAVNAAWEVLGDAGKRAAYDREIGKR